MNMIDRLVKDHSFISRYLVVIFISFLLLRGKIDFHPRWLDCIISDLLFTIPLVLTIIAFFAAKNKKQETRMYFIASLLIIISFLTSFILLFNTPAAYEEVQRLHLKNTDLVVYLGNCGATCPYELDVKQEQKIFYGMYWYSFIDESNPNFDLRFEIIGDNKVRATSTYDGYPGPEDNFKFNNDAVSGHILPGNEFTLPDKIFY